MPFTCTRCHAEIDRNYRACPHCGEPVTDFARRYSNEPLDGKYRIIERLGAGGMGEVYKAEHMYLGAIRVIKVIRPQISESRDAHDRFLREARASTKVQHPNVATLHDFSALPDGSHYMVWEYIDGENLAQRLRYRGTLPPRQAVHIAIQALHGLDAIHRAGIIHRDISPENLMIAADDVVKIIDLGVAKVSDPSEVSATRTGIFVGKLRYASPEHLGFMGDDEKIDGRADLYSLAMVLYEALTGRPPFEAKSPHEYVLLHSRETQFKPLELPPDLPGGEALQAALRKALERDRTKRYATGREFARALEEIERALPDQSALKTVALPFDGDATMRVTPPVPTEATGTRSGGTRPDTLHNPTVRTGVGPGTVATAAPIVAPAPPPRASAPAPAAPVTMVDRAPQPRRASRAPLMIVIVVLLLGAAAAAAWLLMPDEQEPRPEQVAAVTTTNAVTTTATPAVPTNTVPSQTTLDVVEAPTATAPPVLSATTETQAPVSRPAATPRPVGTIQQGPEPQPVREPEPEPAPARAPPAQSYGRAYVDGGGDDDVNEQMLQSAQNALTGVKTISVNAGSMQREVTAALREAVPFATITDGGADVRIDFSGTFERLGRGKKVRAAHATVTRNGRVVFRYELPRQEYRAGMHPAGAFARIISDVITEE
ncbi:MAG TPA: serine/threonine-protein kinase [Thermoanaerobaculia bacterium]|jgi:serine/threonine-protein kinase